MTSLNDTIHTVNAAASAIVSADARVQPTASPKRRWRSFWRVYWCFGSYNKNRKRIGNAVLVPDPVLPGAAAPASAATDTAHSTSVIIPFIAPPSSPASFLQSGPPSSSQSPAGLLSLASLSVKACSPGGPASIFAIGPYTYETQLVSPPVFSTFTTEPSTAPLTPPPESVHQTTPSSPEVPFAQLLTSSLDRSRRNSGNNQKFAWSHYEFQSYPLPGSPGSHLISPGSVISNSGTSSPFPDRLPILGLRIGEAPKLIGFEHFNTRRWGSRLGSGSLTPDGVGLGSRLGSGCVTPDGTGMGSRLGSGSLTPDGVGTATRESYLLVGNASSLPNLANGSKNDELVINHRVSFELTGEDVARCLANKSFTVLGNISESPQDTMEEGTKKRDGILTGAENGSWYGETSSEIYEVSFRETGEENENPYRKQRSITLGSTKEFNFDSSKGDVSDKPAIGSEWWANEKVAGLPNPGKEATPSNHWTFFPMLNPGVS